MPTSRAGSTSMVRHVIERSWFALTALQATFSTSWNSDMTGPSSILPSSSLNMFSPSSYPLSSPILSCRTRNRSAITTTVCPCSLLAYHIHSCFISGGDDFYGWFLGPRMIYTSGVIGNPDVEESLETLQDNKLAIVCSKLDLKPEDRLLDIGCGWGTLVAYAAKNFECDATGVTLARNQAKFGTDRIEKNGVRVF